MSTQRKNISFVHFDLMTCYFVKEYSNQMQVSYYKHIEYIHKYYHVKAGKCC
jgi:hypothetical protein